MLSPTTVRQQLHSDCEATGESAFKRQAQKSAGKTGSVVDHDTPSADHPGL